MMTRSLSRQILIYFLIVIVLSLSTIGIFSYWKAAETVDQGVEKYVTSLIENASTQTDLYLQNYERASDSILSNPDVKFFLDMDPSDTYAFFEFKRQITTFVMRPTFILYKEIDAFYLMGKHGRSIIDDNQNATFADGFDAQKQYNWIWDNTPESGSIAILNRSIKSDAKQDSITIARRIRGYSSYEPKGILAIELRSQELASLWKHVNLGENGFFFILNDDGQMVYPPQGQRPEVSQELIHRLIKEDHPTMTEKMDGKNHLVVSRKSNYSGWRLTVALPLDELRQPINSIRFTVVIVGLITGGIAMFLAARFGNTIVRPFKMLREGMRQTEKGNWSYIELTPRSDELAGLIQSYNLMVKRLSEMIEKVYEAELSTQKSALELQDKEMERQKAEFQALQLQINPHFLYNTLETINCYAIVQESSEITEMVEAMSYMLRYSIQTNLEEITIVNELNHVRNFMIILKHRTGRDFEIGVLVPPNLLLEKMVRLTLQPLVENVFQHAFPDGLEEHHYIHIDAKKENGLLQVSVEDNGVGMLPEKLEELRERLSLNKLAEESNATLSSGGIGLMNVNRRIQMVFGEQYGLTIESIHGKGTKFTMNMPSVPPKTKNKSEGIQ